MNQNRNKPPPRVTHELREDTIWGNINVDQYEELPLAPLDPKTETNRLAIRESFVTVDVVYENESDEEARGSQFSLRQMMIVQACFALLFGLMQIFLPSFVAGALGISVLGIAVLLTLYRPEERQIHFAWWTIFAFYIIACVVAVLRS